jgi:hypothetical protein
MPLPHKLINTGTVGNLTNFSYKLYTDINNLQGNFMVIDGKGVTKTLGGLIFEKNDLDWRKVISKKLLPDDALDYINLVNSHYKFNDLPLAWLGLPQGRNN